MFVIDKSGNVSNLKIKGTGKDGSGLLEDEAERIIRKLPKFTPGKQRGKAVGVSYAQPINFKLENR
jgi:protein TonB